MLNALKTYLIYGKQYCGIEVSNTCNKQCYSVTQLTKQKTELQLKHQFKTDNIDEIASMLPKKQHTFLVVNDTNVLFKKINSKYTQAKQLLNVAFPNINSADFYYEISTQENDIHFIALCRKEYLDVLIGEFEAKNIYITAFSLGNNCITEIKDFISNQIVSTSNANITITDTIDAIEISDTPEQNAYNINGIESSNNYLLSVSGALTSFLTVNTRNSNNNEKTENLIQYYTYATLFVKTLKFSLILMLTALLINFFCFNYYFNAVQELQVTSQINQNNKNTLISLDKKLKHKQKIVDDILKSNASKSSFYTHEIVKTIPNSILLLELNYQPILKNIKKNKNILLHKNTVAITGTSSKSEAFSSWINTLEKLPCISAVEIVNYSDTKGSKSKFTLKLHLSND